MNIKYYHEVNLYQNLFSLFETEMKQFDRETEKYLQSLIPSVSAPLSISHAQRKLQLREKHLQELADTLRGLNPEEVSHCYSYAYCAIDVELLRDGLPTAPDILSSSI